MSDLAVANLLATTGHNWPHWPQAEKKQNGYTDAKRLVQGWLPRSGRARDYCVRAAPPPPPACSIAQLALKAEAWPTLAKAAANEAAQESALSGLLSARRGASCCGC